jgi:hypothetical protein
LKSENVGKFIGPHVILAQIFSALSLSLFGPLSSLSEETVGQQVNEKGNSWAAKDLNREKITANKLNGLIMS